MKRIEDRALIALHRAAELADRPQIALPSDDLQAVDEVTGSRQRSRKALGRLVAGGKVIKVRRDLAVLPSSTGLLGVDLLDLIAAVSAEPSLVTAGRALELRGLSDQHFFQVVVLSTRRVAPISWRGETSKFFPVPKERIWGAAPIGGRSKLPVPIAGPGRAILDSLSHSRYGVSLSQAARALRTALAEEEFIRRFWRATKRYETASVARRAGFLVERLVGRGAAEPFQALIGNSPTPVLLRAGGSSDGPFDRRWRLRLNADLDLVLEVER